MTTNNHTPIATGAAANASTINNPLGQLDAALVAMDTRIDNIVYGGVDLADPLVFESGLTVNDALRVDTSRTLNNDDAGPINLPVWITGTYTTPGDNYSVRHIYGNAVSAGVDDILTLATYYAQTDYGNTGGLLTHGWGGVFRFYKSGNGGDITVCAGVYADCNVSGSGDIAMAAGFFNSPSSVSAGTIGQYFGLDTNEPSVSGSGVVEDNFGIRVGSTTVGTQSNYGVYIEASSGYGLYSESKVAIAEDLEVGGAISVVDDVAISNGDFSVIGDGAVGAELIANGAFTSNTTSWTAVGAALASVTGGQSGNCLEIANSGGTGYAVQGITTIVDGWYKLTFYYKSGTNPAGSFYVGTSSGGSQIHYEALSTAAAWRQHAFMFKATTTTTYIRLSNSGSTEAATSLFDTVSVVQLLGGNVGVNGKITAYGGSSGVQVSSSGSATIDNQAVALGGFRTAAVQIADDAVVNLRALYPNISTTGILQISTGNYGNSTGLINFRAASSPFCVVVAQPGSDIVVGTTGLTNGTSDGTDAKLNIAATSGGELFVKNRRGAAATFIVTIFA